MSWLVVHDSKRSWTRSNEKYALNRYEHNPLNDFFTQLFNFTLRLETIESIIVSSRIYPKALKEGPLDTLSIHVLTIVHTISMKTEGRGVNFYRQPGIDVPARLLAF